MTNIWNIFSTRLFWLIIILSFTGLVTTSNQTRELQDHHSENRVPTDCCPAMRVMTEPQGGRNLEGMYVDLYRDGEIAQRFYEYVCAPEVRDKPCQFIDNKHLKHSRCVQKYSYSYALVNNSDHISAFPSKDGTTPWSLDYIKIGSGCSCEVSIKPEKSN